MCTVTIYIPGVYSSYCSKVLTVIRELRMGETGYPRSLSHELTIAKLGMCLLYREPINQVAQLLLYVPWNLVTKDSEQPATQVLSNCPRASSGLI